MWRYKNCKFMSAFLEITYELLLFDIQVLIFIAQNYKKICSMNGVFGSKL